MFVDGACEVPVNSLEECLHYLELGEQNRCAGVNGLMAEEGRHWTADCRAAGPIAWFGGTLSPARLTGHDTRTW